MVVSRSRWFIHLSGACLKKVHACLFVLHFYHPVYFIRACMYIHPDVCPSVRPSVCPSVCPSVRPSICPSVGKVSATFRENYWLNSFHPWDLYLWGKSLDPYRFSCSCPHFWPSGGQKLTEIGVSAIFAKTVGSIHFIPGIYTYGVSLWTPIDFRVRALIFGPLVAKNWPKIGVSATFRENCRLDSFHPWDLYLWGKSLDPYRFSCSCPHFWPSGGQKLTENRGFRNFSRKLSALFISSLGFILMG